MTLLVGVVVLFSAATGTRGCAGTLGIGARAWEVESQDPCLVESWRTRTVLPTPATVEPSMVSGKIIGISGGVASPACEEGKGLGLSKLNRSALTRK